MIGSVKSLAIEPSWVFAPNVTTDVTVEMVVSETVLVTDAANQGGLGCNVAPIQTPNTAARIHVRTRSRLLIFCWIARSPGGESTCRPAHKLFATYVLTEPSYAYQACRPEGERLNRSLLAV